MKNKYFILTVMMLIAGLVQTGFCLNSVNSARDYQDQDKQAHKGVMNAKTGFDKDWHDFKVDAEVKINANEKKIGELQVKIKKSGKDLRADYNKEVGVLEQKNADLKIKINEFKYESKDKWEEFKTGFNRDMDAVGNGIKNFFTKKDDK
jgi:hypothetical protein